jgi:UDP-N-acetylmuramoylalanine--D-glutamate ligase
MEYVAAINGIKFINDSKATTVDSCAWALKNIHDPVILIAGGKDKGIDYNLILDYSRGKVKEAILFGQARKKIGDVFQGNIPFEESVNLEDAVNKAFYKAQPGDCVLLSPMCASFDMFSSYEERGRVFKEIVHRLAAEAKI